MNLQKIKSHLFPKGFTLVELIVVITILAILGTIGFLSIWGYSSKARDSARIGDVAQISKSLDLSIVTAWDYPAPDNAFSVTYSGGVIWNQGTIGNNVLQVMKSSIAGGGLNKKPTDPLTNKEYTYSELAEGKAYQIKVDYEGDLAQTAIDASLIDSASAAPGNPTIAYIRGNFGGLTAKTTTWSTVFILAIPSIMSNTGTVGVPIEIRGTTALSGALLFHGQNLKGATSFNPNVVVFTGTIVDTNKLGLPSTTTEITNMMTLLQSTYSGSNVRASQSVSSLIAMNTGALVDLWKTAVIVQLGGVAGGGGIQNSIPETPLYEFTSHTFTNCGTTGRTGPALATCQSSYNTAEANTWKGTYLTMVTNGIQEWTVPSTGTYKITSLGAGVSSHWGRGAKIEGDVLLSKGQKIKILVGQQGYNGGSSDIAGNGGTFVTTIDNQPIMIAGGGGGGYGDTGTYESCGRVTKNGGNSWNPWYYSAAGGTNGGGGAYISSNSQWGAGLTGNGQWSSTLAQSFVNGGVGGSWSYAGGFGGGGGTTSWGGGGGGGYSGGGASYNGANGWPYASGAGGGSYNSGTNQVQVACFQAGHGSVTITKVVPVTEIPLYTFTTHTFTNCGTTGRTGPSLATCRSSYNTAEVNTWKNTYLSMGTNGIQEWTVPSSGMYKVSAQWAGVSSNGGEGAKIEGDVYFTKNQTIRILVGQQGYNVGSSATTGNGGTFVATSDNQPIIVAGGGGGGYCDTGASYESCGRITNNWGNTYNLTYGSAANGGTGGAGGFQYSNGDAGAGMYGNGAGSSTLAQSFVNGGVGGSYSWAAGFGGGGSSTSWGGGGGGGYSGGGGSYSGGSCWAYATGAGGWSFNDGSNKVEVSCSNSGQGFVTITKL